MAAIDIFGSFMDPLNQDQGASKLVNCRIVQRLQVEQKPAQTRLVGSPGLYQTSHPNGTACIALCNALGTVWSIHADGNVYHHVETLAPGWAGTCTIGTPPIARLAEDRTALVIATNGLAGGGTGSAYTARLVSTLAKPPTADVPFPIPAYPVGVYFSNLQGTINFDPSSVCVLDNYTVWAAASNTYANQSDKMYTSEALLPDIVDANHYAVAEARADAILDVVTLGRTFFAFGTRTVEMWYAQGGTSDFAFTAFTNSLIEVGLASRRTLATLHGMAIWVGTDRRVWMGKGQSGQPISPGWVDLLLQQISFSALTAYMYAQGGDEFYVLTNEGQWSIELAVATMTWIYRQSFRRSDHAGRCAVECDGGVCYVGLDTGEICQLALGTASEPAGLMPRTIISPWIGVQEARNIINQVDITSYMGPDAGQFTLDWSEDRATTWKGQRTITWPEPGTRRAIARVLGSSRRRQIRLSYSGPQAPFEVDEFFVSASNEV